MTVESVYVFVMHKPHEIIYFPKVQALVPGVSNKLAEWLIESVCNFSPWANSAMEAVKETKFGTKAD